MIQNVGYDGHLADLWSCGVILYFLLSGGKADRHSDKSNLSLYALELPFEDNSVPNLLEKIVSANYQCPKTFSKSAKGIFHPKNEKFTLKLDLLAGILNPNPKKRFTLDAIKKHPWFLEY